MAAIRGLKCTSWDRFRKCGPLPLTDKTEENNAIVSSGAQLGVPLYPPRQAAHMESNDRAYEYWAGGGAAGGTLPNMHGGRAVKAHRGRIRMKYVCRMLGICSDLPGR